MSDNKCMASQAVANSAERPNIYAYHSLHEFLNDTIKYLTEKNHKFSLRRLAIKSGVNHGQISRLLNRHATITEKVLEKLLPELELNQEESSFLFALRSLSESKTQEDRVKAFKKILRFRNFKTLNQQNLIEHEYLSNWYYPVIRELAKLPEFKLNARWIRSQLQKKITVSEAQLAINFLVNHGYLDLDYKGRVKVTKTQITCASGIYRLAASEYHEQLLKLANESIYDVERDLREISSHTLAMPKDKIVEVRNIIRNAIQQIRDLDMEDGERDSVYQISLLAFPVAQVKKAGGQE
jgi:uncharacterized protein (TIGR02147 family)